MRVPLYQSLVEQEFRLLSVFPGCYGDEIKCRLFPTLLSGESQYEALSYVWGSAEKCETIFVNGQPIKVTSNLERALRHLRCNDRPRTLWVDALCINQEDLGERSDQVANMNLIYSLATATIVYLGDEDEHTAGGFDMLRMFAQNLHFDQYPIWRADIRNKPSLMPSDLVSARHVLALPWWQRTWVVQEIALAKAIFLVCGKQSLSWDKIVAPAAKAINEHVNSCCTHLLASPVDAEVGRTLQMMRAEINNLQLIRDTIQGTKSNPVPPLYQIISCFRHRRATDSRDKIYGFLALHRPNTANQLRADYTLSLNEAYMKAAFSMIQNARTLDLLYYAGYDERKKNLPSWVPDWTLEDSATKDIYWQSGHAEHLQDYNAAGDLPFELHNINRNLLVVNGMTFDAISRVGLSMFYDIDKPYEAGPVLHNWESGIANFEKEMGVSKDYAGGGLWKDAYWQTLCADLIAHLEVTLRGFLPQDQLLKVCLELFKVYRVWSGLSNTLIGHDKDAFANPATDPTQPKAFGQIMFFVRGIQTRRLFLTQKGYLGLGPRSLRPGDEIRLLAGGKTPFVMRPSKTIISGQHVSSCYLIGDAYIHGIMHGEGLPQNAEDMKMVSKIIIQ